MPYGLKLLLLTGVRILESRADYLAADMNELMASTGLKALTCERDPSARGCEM